MAVNKVMMNTDNGVETIIDLTEDTVTPETLAEGATAHNAAGEVIRGALRVIVPQKGIDYWTEADQEAIVQDVIKALGTPVFGRVDADNNIILSGDLAEGTYTVKFENADGTVTAIGTLSHTVVVEPDYTNVLAAAIDKYGNVYDGVGYKNGTYLTSNGTAFADDPLIGNDANCFSTGFMPYTYNDLANRVPFYVKGVDLSDSIVTANASHIRIAVFNTLNESTPRGGYLHILASSTPESQRFTCTKLGDKYYSLTPGGNSKFFGEWNNNSTSAPYARLTFPGNGEGVIITINEPIE